MECYIAELEKMDFDVLEICFCKTQRIDTVHSPLNEARVAFSEKNGRVARVHSKTSVLVAAFVPCGWVYTVPTGAQTHAISDMVKQVILVRSATLNPMSKSAPPSNR